jgi:hypothetical protein
MFDVWFDGIYSRAQNLDDFGDLTYLDDLVTEDNEAIATKKSLRSIINRGLPDEDRNEQNLGSKRKKTGGDDDIPYRDRKQARLINSARGEDYNRHLDSDGDAQEPIAEDEYYASTKASKQAKREGRQEAHDQYTFFPFRFKLTLAANSRRTLMI